MPQLWTETIVTQYFWLVAILFGFYFLASTKIIPQIANTLKIRRELSASNSTTSTALSAPIAENFKSSKSLLSSILVLPAQPVSVSSIEKTNPVTSQLQNSISTIKAEWVKKYSTN